MRCCICGKEIRSSIGANNPRGACWKDEEGNIVEAEFKAEDVCCNECNEKFVIPGRIYRLYKNKKES